MSMDRFGVKIVADVVNTQPALVASWTDEEKKAALEAAKLLASAFAKKLIDEDGSAEAKKASEILKKVRGQKGATSEAYLVTSLLRMAYADASSFAKRA